MQFTEGITKEGELIKYGHLAQYFLILRDKIDLSGELQKLPPSLKATAVRILCDALPKYRISNRRT